MPPNRKLTEFFSKSISPHTKINKRGSAPRSGSSAGSSPPMPQDAQSQLRASTTTNVPIIDNITDGDTSGTDESIVILSQSERKALRPPVFSAAGAVGVSCRRPLKHRPPREIIDLSSSSSSLSPPKEKARVSAHMVISDSDAPSSNSSVMYLGNGKSSDKRKEYEACMTDNSVEEVLELTAVAPTSLSASEPENEASMDWESSPSHVISTPSPKPLSQRSSRSNLPTPALSSPDTSIGNASMPEPPITPPNALRLPTPTSISPLPSSHSEMLFDQGSSLSPPPSPDTVASARKVLSSEDEGLILSIDKLDDDMSDEDDGVDIDDVLGLKPNRNSGSLS